MTEKTRPLMAFIPHDDFAGDPPRADIPLTVRQRLNWSDVDAAQIGYTARQMALAIDAIEIWWEQVMATNLWELRSRGFGAPSVKAEIEFHHSIGPSERVDNEIFVEAFGNSSLTLRVEGYNVDRVHCFTARQISVLVDNVPDAPKARPFDAAQRQRLEGYQRECDLRRQGVKTKREVLDYWYGPTGTPDRGEARAFWFGGGDKSVADIDADIRENFLSTLEAAMRGDLDHWQVTPMGALALTLVLDQFPRNIFRGKPAAFASDAKALSVARAAIEKGFDEEMGDQARRFLYLPFEHAEDLAVQAESLKLFGSFKGTPLEEDSKKYAQMHYDIVERFGRFPHRNAILGRDSTAEELIFLEDDAVHFGQNK